MQYWHSRALTSENANIASIRYLRMAYRLSKSRLLSFVQCPRKLWLEIHRRELARLDPARLARFDAGHQVGEIARWLYGQAAVESGASVDFEAHYVHEHVVIRADVIERPGLFGSALTGPRVIEVKSSSGVSPQHVVDCAIQAWVIQGAGERPHGIAVAHIDGRFTYAGGGDYRGLLTEADVTSKVAPMLADVARWAREAQVVLAGPEPVVTIGTRCFSPRPCPFVSHCWPQVEYPLTSLPHVRKHLDAYLARGYRDLRDVPEEELRSADAIRVSRATRAGVVQVSDSLRAELRALPYPRYYLDFETIGPCIPLWTGTSPNQPVPYQWSVHVERAPSAALEHLEYLDLSGALPARGVAESLVRALGTEGPIVTYSSYERTCLRTLARFVPELAEALAALAARMVDLLPVVRGGYYHPAMQGSWSIKSVLPAIAPDMRYEDLGEVKEGLGAERAYLQAIDPATSPVRREVIRRALLRYCEFDTLAMVRIVRELA